MSGSRREYISTVPSIQPDKPSSVRKNGPAFVDPGPKQLPARVEVLPPVEAPPAPTPPLPGGASSRAESRTTGSYTDRALGFALVVTVLGVALGSLGVVIAVAAWGVPWLSVPALAWFGSLFAATWLVAYVVHVLISPEGAAWIHVLRGWRWIDEEQRHRHELERYRNGLEGRK